MVTEEILYHITGNSQLSNTNVDEISAIVKEYPFFSPAQFLLALKQKKENSYNFEYQLQKASLYFSNQVWLNYLLTEKEMPSPILQAVEAEPVAPQTEMIRENIFPTSIIGSSSSDTHYEEEEAKEQEELLDDISDNAVENGIPLSNNIPFDYSSLFTDSNSNIEVPTLEAVKDILGSNSTPVDEAEPIIPEAKLSEFTSIPSEPSATLVSYSRIPSFSFITTEIKSEESAEEVSIPIEKRSSIYVSRPTPVSEENDDSTTYPEDKLEAIVSETENAVSDSEEQNNTTIPSYSFKGFAQEDEESRHTDTVSISEAYANEQSAGDEEGDADDTDYNNNISSMISTQLEGFKKPVEENSKFEFENENNLHTIDYFASQGIKIDLTKLPQDKLTVQMRRFTDWLKQIKKTDPNPQDLGTDPELEKAIQNIAKTSIEAKEIVTETMADVFIKQGKVNKAIQLYIKLSFLDPSKSTYFANKIQQLKGI